MIDHEIDGDRNSIELRLGILETLDRSGQLYTYLFTPERSPMVELKFAQKRYEKVMLIFLVSNLSHHGPDARTTMAGNIHKRQTLKLAATKYVLCVCFYVGHANPAHLEIW